MKHAYMIMAHNNFNILKLLLRALDDDRNDIYIHIDKKADAFLPDDFQGICHRSKLLFLPRRSLHWAGYSLVDETLELLAEAVKKPHDYYHLISGVDMPLESNDGIDAFFERNRGCEFIAFSPLLEEQTPGVTERIRYRHIFSDSFIADWDFLKLFNPKNWLPGRNNPWQNTARNIDWKIMIPLQRALGADRTRNTGFTYRWGSQWFSVTGEFALYLLDNRGIIEKNWKQTSCSDECVMQTMVWNSEYRERLYRNPSQSHDITGAMRYIDWDRGDPYTYDSQDFDMLMDSGMLFARKFDEQKDFEIVKRIFTEVTGQKA